VAESPEFAKAIAHAASFLNIDNLHVFGRSYTKQQYIEDFAKLMDGKDED
jgi:hypothetical protein